MPIRQRLPIIALATRIGVSETDRSQLERKELARGAWAEGRPDDALILLRTVVGEQMSPPVAAECFVTEAAFLAALGEWDESGESLRRAAEVIDTATERVQGSFYHQRARWHESKGRIDAALLDYGGAIIHWENEPDLIGKPVLNSAGDYLLLNDFEQAHEYVNRAIAIFKENGSADLAQAYDTQASIFFAEGRLELACNAINKALALVGENELWRTDFLTTKEKIKTKLIELLDLKSVKEVDQIQLAMIKAALIKTNGAYEAAGKLVGVPRKTMEYMVDHKDDLKEFRKPKRVRRKSIKKQPK